MMFLINEFTKLNTIRPLKPRNHIRKEQYSTFVSQINDSRQGLQKTTTASPGTKNTVLLKTELAAARNEDGSRTTRVKV